MSVTPEYTLWSNIKQRCNNVNHRDYKYYGGRGIKMFPEWENDFNKFFEHIGVRPAKNYSLDRTDNELGYIPGNVRWVDKKTQVINRRVFSNKLYTKHKGIYLTPFGTWQARIKRDGKNINLGTYPTEEVACIAYKAAFIALHG